MRSTNKEVSADKLSDITDRWEAEPKVNTINDKWIKHIPKITEEIPDLRFNKDNIFKAFETLKSNKSPKLTEFTKKFYCKFKNQTYRWIKRLGNLVLDKTIDNNLLEWWRAGATTLLPKNSYGDPRPITMLNTSWKVFSIVIHIHLSPFLNKILHPNQLARSKRWIHEAHVLLSRAIEQGVMADCVDFAKVTTGDSL